MKSIAEQRLFSQQLARSKFKKPADAVFWMGAIQAQDYAGAKWSIGLRVPGCTDAGVEQALIDKKIVRTWAMRGTLHFVAAVDIGWMLELLAPRIIANNARRYKELELDGPTFVRSNDTIAKALQGGNQLDRPALKAVLEKKGISTAGQRTPYLLQRAALDRLICQGIMRGGNPTFFLLHELVRRTKAPQRAEALAELALRYFTSRGPATLRDFIWWSGLSTKDAAGALDAIKSKLASHALEGQTYWSARTVPAGRKISAIACLLPGFDEYLLSYKDRSASMDVASFRKRIPSNGMLPPTIVINGSVAGTWKRTIRKDTVVVDRMLFSKLSDEEERALALAINRYGEYLETGPKLKNKRALPPISFHD